MILNSRDYLMGGYYDNSRECYTIHYRTWKQTKPKFRAFTTLEEAVKWAKRQRGKIITDCGSWQILETLNGVDIFAEPAPHVHSDADIPKYLRA